MTRRLPPSLLLALVVVVVFASVCGHEFLDYDDAVNIHANAEVTNFSLANLLRFWQRPYLNLYIPVTYNLWALLARLSSLLPGGSAGPANPHLFHAANLLCHLLAATAVFAILKGLVKGVWPAWAGAVLFAIHPLQVEAVAWATGMKDVLSGMLALIACHHYLSFAQLAADSDRRWARGHYALSLLAFALAMLAKPGAVAMPLAVGLIAWLWLGRRPGRVAVELLPWLLLAAPVVAVTGLAQNEPNHVWVPALWQRLLVAGDTFTFYLAKLLLPVTLGPDYGRTPAVALAQGRIYLTGLFPYVTMALLLWKASRPWLVAVGVFLLVVLPVSGIIPFVFQQISTVADRYLYLAMLGPALGLAWALSRPRARLVWALALVALAMLAAKSMLQVRYWREPQAFYDHALAVNPRSWTAYNNLGNLLADRNQPREAIAAYEEAIAIDPEYSDAYNNLGAARAATKEWPEAIAAFTRALEINPLSIDAALNLADAYRASGQSEEAVASYRWVISAAPDSAKAYYKLCNLYHELKQDAEAVSCYNTLLTLRPDAAEVYNNLGTVYQDLDQDTLAIEAYRQALRLRPDAAEVYNNLGFLYAAEKRYDEAIPFYTKAAELLPDHPKPRRNLGLAYEALGRTEEAIAWLEKAIAVDPSFAPAFNDLARIYLQRAQYSQAVQYGDRARALGLMDPEQWRALAPYRQQGQRGE